MIVYAWYQADFKLSRYKGNNPAYTENMWINFSQTSNVMKDNEKLSCSVNLGRMERHECFYALILHPEYSFKLGINRFVI